jgi:hypothetical protein
MISTMLLRISASIMLGGVPVLFCLLPFISKDDGLNKPIDYVFGWTGVAIASGTALAFVASVLMIWSM